MKYNFENTMRFSLTVLVEKSQAKRTQNQINKKSHRNKAKQNKQNKN